MIGSGAPGPREVAIAVKPASYEKPYREEASAIASNQGLGLRVEIGNTMTYFYGTTEIPVGSVEIHANVRWGGPMMLLTTLERASDEFDLTRAMYDWKLRNAASALAEHIGEAIAYCELNPDLKLGEEIARRIRPVLNLLDASAEEGAFLATLKNASAAVYRESARPPRGRQPLTRDADDAAVEDGYDGPIP